jgi:hypothetical protein
VAATAAARAAPRARSCKKLPVMIRTCRPTCPSHGLPIRKGTGLIDDPVAVGEFAQDYIVVANGAGAGKG